MNVWKLKSPKANIKLMADRLDISEAYAKVLSDKGVNTVNLYKRYTNSSIENLSNFTQAKGVDDAFDLIETHIKNNSKITLFSDYDCDGVTSSTIMYKGLKELYPNIDLNYNIPHRIHDGYGLNKNLVQKMIDEGYKLMITLDNGIASLEEIRLARQGGMDVIVIDHHEPVFNFDTNTEVLPVANTIIDPKQRECKFYFRELCTAGLSFSFINALAIRKNTKLDCYEEILQFSAIGTVVDIVELTGENRIIVKNGLRSMNSGIINNGLKALFDKMNYAKDINVHTLGFIIGPCINAIGRLDHAKKGVELFTTTEQYVIENLANIVYNTNVERKNMTESAIKNVENIVEQHKFYEDDIIVAYDDTIHESIAGNIASKVKDKYNRPTIILTKGEDMPKGSARSIDTYDVFKGLTECKHLLGKFGGHTVAAGLSIPYENINEFRALINKNAKLTEEHFVKTIEVNKILKLNEVTYSLYEQLSNIEPCGKGNKMPVFASVKCLIRSVRVDDEKNYFRLNITDDSINRDVTVIAFGENEKFKQIILGKYEEYYANKIFGGVLRDIELYMDFVYKIDINEYMGNISMQLKPVDYRISI